MVVRKGKVAGAQVMGGVGVGTGPQYGGSNPRGNNPAGTNNTGTGRTTTTEIGARGEIGPSDDMLRVYIVTPDGRRGAMVWSGEMKDGLNSPSLTLLRQLRQEIDHAYPPQTAAKKP
jgi:hypothetical protein